MGELEQKHFMEPNGMLHNDYPDETCSHKGSMHLDQYGMCICDSFRYENKTIGWEDQLKKS